MLKKRRVISDENIIQKQQHLAATQELAQEESSSSCSISEGSDSDSDSDSSAEMSIDGGDFDKEISVDFQKEELNQIMIEIDPQEP